MCEAERAPAEDRVENPVHRDGREQFRLGAVVVGLVVGEDQCPEPLDPGVLQLSRDPVAGRPGVDEDRRRGSGLEQDRVALADVEHRDAQSAEGRRPTGPLPRAQNSPDEEGNGHHGRERRPRETARTARGA